MTIWYILRNWVVFPRFGILYQEKSGNPAGYLDMKPVNSLDFQGDFIEAKTLLFRGATTKVGCGYVSYVDPKTPSTPYRQVSSFVVVDAKYFNGKYFTQYEQLWLFVLFQEENNASSCIVGYTSTLFYHSQIERIIYNFLLV
jgi:hypothetical protein